MKNTIWTYDEYTLPVWAICPIVNDDYSGIEDEDSQAIEEFLKTLPENGSFEFPDNTDEEKYFTHGNDIPNLGDDVIDCKYHYQTDDIEIIIATCENQAREIKELKNDLKRAEQEIEQLENEESDRIESLQSCLEEYEDMDIPELKTLANVNRFQELIEQF